MSLKSRRYGNPLKIKPARDTKVTLETPMGPKEFTWDYNDSIKGVYRGEEVFCTDPEAVMKRIAAIEEEFQTKKIEVAKRKEVAKTPVPAFFVTVLANKVSLYSNPTDAEFRKPFEEVLVRGVDQRSGNALIIREDGSKESVHWRHLVRDMDDSDLADLRALVKHWGDALAAAKSVKEELLVRSEDLLADALGLDDAQAVQTIEATLDLETFERVVTWDGQEFRGKSLRDLEEKVNGWIVNSLGYTRTYSFYLRSKSESKPTLDGISYSTQVARTEADIEKIAAADDEIVQAEQALIKAVEEEAFDKSLVMVQPDAPEPQEREADVPAIQAPGYEEDF